MVFIKYVPVNSVPKWIKHVNIISHVYFCIGIFSGIMSSDKDNIIPVGTDVFSCTPIFQHNSIYSLRSTGDQNFVSGCLVTSISYKHTQSLMEIIYWVLGFLNACVMKQYPLMDSCGRACAQIRKQCPITLRNINGHESSDWTHNSVLILCTVFLKQNTLNPCIVMCIMHSGCSVTPFLLCVLRTVHEINAYRAGSGCPHFSTRE